MSKKKKLKAAKRELRDCRGKIADLENVASKVKKKLRRQRKRETDLLATIAGAKEKSIDVAEGKPFTVPVLEMEMLWCEPGTFTMGSPLREKDRYDKETQHTVTLTKGFWLGKHQVTQAQYEAVMGNNPSEFKGENLPVESVSWDDATSFCEKLTERENKAGSLPEGYAYQLPTEAQWEYACRAGTKTAFAFGDSLSSKQANFNGEDPYGGAAQGPWLQKTASVGSYPANAWGFHDMHGSVWEWCHDWCADYPGGVVRDPTGPASGSYRVRRGGSWYDDGHSLRSAGRNGLTPGGCNGALGFRVGFRFIGE